MKSNKAYRGQIIRRQDIEHICDSIVLIVFLWHGLLAALGLLLRVDFRAEYFAPMHLLSRSVVS